jgi:RimJ/RimL family protein N-acetyltransferase
MTQANILKCVSLSNESACLEPLSLAHCADLQVAVGHLHTLWYTAIPTPEGMAAEIERRLNLHAKGSMLPFAAIDSTTGKAVGMTTFMNIDAVHQRLEIGSTWTSATMQRTGFNTACKHLLLSHAFDTLSCIAVEFRTHRFNMQSRVAISRLGAQFDGFLRNHQRASNGTLRDTAVYSITAPEWPTVDAHLRFQMTRSRTL